MNPPITIQGRSFFFNSIFVFVNFIAITFIALGFHKNFEDQSILFLIVGFLLLAVTTFGIIVFKGKLLMSAVARVIVGSICIVSGLVKANDPLGFSYKLEEYFEDGALAYRIKELFNAPSFSLEFLMDYALFFSILICIVEIVLGVLVLIGGKMKLISYLLLGMMLFFTFLTWHSASCDPNKKFIDRDTYAINSELAQIKLAESKTNKQIKIVSKNSNQVIVEEMKQPQCVSDCGCFGDALKGSVGRSLTPIESLWKDLILVYLVVWIFLAQWKTQQNTLKANVWYLFSTLFLIIFFSWVFDWYFPILFGLIVLLGGLWMKQAGGKHLSNSFGSAIFVSVVSTLLIVYVLMYEPIKDYRPYSVGTNIRWKMNDGKPGKYETILVYKNNKTGKTREYEATSKKYVHSKIWENKNWKYLSSIQKTIIESKLPSITEQFNPFKALQDLSIDELKIPFVRDFIKKNTQEIYTIQNLTDSNDQFEINSKDYNTSDYPTTLYQIVNKVKKENSEVSEISMRDYIVKSNLIFVLIIKNLEDANFSSIQKISKLEKECNFKKIPFIIISNESAKSMNSFKRKNGLHIAAFTNDETELKAITRSNPALMIIKKGIIIGKYPHRSIPTFEWLSKNILVKK